MSYYCGCSDVELCSSFQIVCISFQKGGVSLIRGSVSIGSPPRTIIVGEMMLLYNSHARQQRRQAPLFTNCPPCNKKLLLIKKEYQIILGMLDQNAHLPFPYLPFLILRQGRLSKLATGHVDASEKEEASLSVGNTSGCPTAACCPPSYAAVIVERKTLMLAF